MANAPTNDVALLLRAAKDDDVRGLNTLYEDLQGDIDLSNAIGQNALHVAAIWGSLGAIEFLLEHGCDMDAQNRDGATPLHFASLKGQHEAARLLLEAGADPNQRTSAGKTPADMAEDDEMRTLLGSSPLLAHEAAKRRDVNALEEAVGEGCRFDRLDGDGQTALHIAVRCASEDPKLALRMVTKICEAGRDATVHAALARRSPKTGLTPVHLAAQSADVAILRALLSAGEAVGAGQLMANCNSLNVSSMHNGNWGKKNARGDLEEIDAAKATPLTVALQRLIDCAEDDEKEASACADIVHALLDHGADVNLVDGDGAAPLHLAVSSGRVGVVRALLDAGADAAATGKFVLTGNTSLHHAVRVGDAAIIAALCGHRHKYTPPPNVDAFGAGGWTALGLATRAGNAAAAEALLAAGARADAKMGNGKTPLDIARINNKAAIVEMFERRASGGA